MAGAAAVPGGLGYDYLGGLVVVTMKEITYADILSRYPILATDMPIDALVRLAYMAGRLDRMTEDIEQEQERLAKKEIETRQEIRSTRTSAELANENAQAMLAGADRERENLARKEIESQQQFKDAEAKRLQLLRRESDN